MSIRNSSFLQYIQPLYLLLPPFCQGIYRALVNALNFLKHGLIFLDMNT